MLEDLLSNFLNNGGPSVQRLMIAFNELSRVWMGEPRWKTKRLYILRVSSGTSAHLAQSILMSSLGEKGFAYRAPCGTGLVLLLSPLTLPQKKLALELYLIFKFEAKSKCALQPDILYI